VQIFDSNFWKDTPKKNKKVLVKKSLQSDKIPDISPFAFKQQRSILAVANGKERLGPLGVIYKSPKHPNKKRFGT